MPKVVSESKKRVPLNCLVAPATRNTITRLRGNRSQGELVDAAIAAFERSSGIVDLRKVSARHRAILTKSDGDATDSNYGTAKSVTARPHTLHSGTRPIEGCGECEKLK